MNAKIDPVAVGRRIKSAREAAGLSQVQVAEHVGGHDSKVSNWEKGKRLPETEPLYALAYLFEMSVDFLLTGESTAAPEDLALMRRVGRAEGRQELLRELNAWATERTVAPPEPIHAARVTVLTEGPKRDAPRRKSEGGDATS